MSVVVSGMKWLCVLLLALTVASAPNPEENLRSKNPNLMEGDMILSKEQISRAEKEEDIDISRKRGAARSRLWPKGVVVYAVYSSLARNSRAMGAIRAAMADWTRKTCIRFKKRSRESAFVYFRPGQGCASYVGRIGRRQDLLLASGCWYPGIVGHEIGHAIGYYHEQSRPDRDTYVKVRYENIRTGLERNFHKYPRSTIDSLGTPYDYNSLMHYGATAFSKNGRPTIEAKNGARIGQRQGLSTIDAKQANLLYKAQCALRGSCKDKTSLSKCQRWARSGFCRTHRYIKTYCQKTCKLCV